MRRAILLIPVALLCAGSASAQQPPRPLWTAPAAPALSVTPGLPAGFSAVVPAGDAAAAPAPVVLAGGHVDRKGH